MADTTLHEQPRKDQIPMTHKSLIDHGSVFVPPQVFQAAYELRLENYKVNTPKKFQVRHLHTEHSLQLMGDLAQIAGVPMNKIDYVYFSCCLGAEEHTDALDAKKFTAKTLIVPVVVPPGKATLWADGMETQMQANHVYEFNHERPHSLTLEDTTSGCTVIMASVLH